MTASDMESRDALDATMRDLWAATSAMHMKLGKCFALMNNQGIPADSMKRYRIQSGQETPAELFTRANEVTRLTVRAWDEAESAKEVVLQKWEEVNLTLGDKNHVNEILSGRNEPEGTDMLSATSNDNLLEAAKTEYWKALDIAAEKVRSVCNAAKEILSAKEAVLSIAQKANGNRLEYEIVAVQDRIIPIVSKWIEARAAVNALTQKWQRLEAVYHEYA